MALSPREIEQVGDLLGVDPEHRSVLHPVGSSHHAQHPLRCRHRARRQIDGRSLRSLLRGLARLRHDHACPVAEQLQRVAGHRVERLDPSFVQDRQRCGGTPVTSISPCRSVIGGHQTEESHEPEGQEWHDKIGCCRGGADACSAGRRQPISGPAVSPPLVAAGARAAARCTRCEGRIAIGSARIKIGSRCQASLQTPIVAVRKPQEGAAEVGEHAPEGEDTGDVGDQPTGIFNHLQAGHFAPCAVGELHLRILALVEGFAAVPHRIVHPDAAVLLRLCGGVGERHVGGVVTGRLAGTVVNPPDVGERDGVGLVFPAIPQLQLEWRAVDAGRIDLVAAAAHEDLRLVVHELTDEERAHVGAGCAVSQLYISRSDVCLGACAPLGSLVGCQPTLAESRRRQVGRDRAHADHA